MKKPKSCDSRKSQEIKEASSTELFEKALALAHQAAEQDEVPVGAVIVKDGVVIGTGYNRREQNQDPLAHAEIMAIAEAAKHLKSWRLVDCTLVVTLEPCPMCLAACQQARIEQVFYGATDPKGGALSLGYRLHEDARTHHRFEVIHRENSDCQQVLRDFFKMKRLKKVSN